MSKQVFRFPVNSTPSELGPSSNWTSMGMMALGGMSLFPYSSGNDTADPTDSLDSIDSID